MVLGGASGVGGAPACKPRRRGLRDRPPHLYVGEVPTPLLMGIRRPTILLPTAVVREATEAHLGWIMAHEAAHIQRWDMLWGWIFLLVRSVFFFHPMVWLTCAEWSL